MVIKHIFKQGTTPSECAAFGEREPSESENLDGLTPEQYAALRAEYVKAGHGVPPPGAEPMPERNEGEQ